MNVGVIGCGVVGGTLVNWLEEKSDYRVSKFDPFIGLNDRLTDCEVFFICVPVPTNDDGTQNEDALWHSVHLARSINPKAQVFIRSSVLPGTADKYGCISMPEFLTERQAKTDMACLPILVGKNGESLARWIFNDRPVIAVTNIEAELAKYIHNVFGAMKVTFFNIVKHMCSDFNLSYENVLRGASITGFIEKTHTQVPGPDGRNGYGGKCFPKDVRAFANFAKRTIGESPLLNAIDWENDYYRNYSADCQREESLSSDKVEIKLPLGKQCELS